jgi:hypothetical protein
MQRTLRTVPAMAWLQSGYESFMSKARRLQKALKIHA